MATRQKTALRVAEREQRAARAMSTLKRIASTARRQLGNIRQKSDLSGAQLWALWQVKNAPGLTMQELAASMSLHQSTTSNLVEKLESGGFVRKKRETLDRRIVRLHATAAATQQLKKAPIPAQSALPDAMNQLTDEELKALEKSLALLAKKIGLERDEAKQGLPELLT